MLPGAPGPVPGPSFTGGLPGGCGSLPLPTPLFPWIRGWEPSCASAGLVRSVTTAGATHTAALTNDLRECLRSDRSDWLMLSSLARLSANRVPGCRSQDLESKRAAVERAVQREKAVVFIRHGDHF